MADVPPNERGWTGYFRATFPFCTVLLLQSLMRQGAIKMRLSTRNSAIAMVIALALAIAAGGAAAAQGHPGQGGGPGMMGDKMAKELNLTADQQAKLKQLMEADR